MRKGLIMALAALLAFTMVGCGGSKNNSKNNSDSAKESKEKITLTFQKEIL